MNRTLCGIKHGMAIKLRKKNNSVEKKGFLYASFPPPSCQKQGKWKQKVES